MTRRQHESDPRDRGGPAQPLLLVNNLRKHFPVRGGLLNRQVATVQAVDDVSFSVRKGETLGIVGESGCGKSTTARLLMRLIEPDAGDVVFDGDPVGDRHGITVNAMRRQMQMVFQDSYSSLNPRMTMAESIAYAPRMHGVPARESLTRAEDLLVQVGLNPRQYARRYPHELSGGQRQRVNIARALALEPRLVILDEAVVGARQVDRGAGAEPAVRTEGTVQPHLPVHQPRPQRRRVCQRPRAGDVSRPRGRDRSGGIDLRADRAIPIRARCSPPSRRWIRIGAPPRCR